MTIPKSVPKKLAQRIQYWVDEKDMGFTMVIGLKNGWHWDRQYTAHVAGFDTLDEALDALKNTKVCTCCICDPDKLWD